MDKKNNTVLYVVIVALSVLVLLLGGYLLFDKVFSNSNTKTDKVDNSDVNNTSLVSKIDNTRDWVYDAEYEKDVTATTYTTKFNKTYDVKDILVPYINIHSSYAVDSNKEIKKIFDLAIEKYNAGVTDKLTYVDVCSYKKYVSTDVLSVVLTYGVGATSVVHPQYYVYNFDLKTGDKLSYDAIYNLAGLQSSTIDSKVEEAITAALKEKMLDYPNETNFDKYSQESIKNYKDSVNDRTLKYFLSEDGKLNVVVKLSVPAGDGEIDTVVVVE